MNYETHITIEPVLDPVRLTDLKMLAAQHNFKVADLLLQRRHEDTPERSKYDTFMTGHASTMDGAQHMVRAMVMLLRTTGYTVWRYKIERIELDSRQHDSLGLLK